MTVPQGATDEQVRAAMARVPVQELRAPVFLRVGAAAVAGFFVAALVVGLAQALTGAGPGPVSLLVVAVLSLLLSAAAAGVWRSRVRLGPDGAATTLGRLREVRWEQVDRIRVVFRPGTSTNVTLDREGARMLLSSTAVELAPVLRAVLALRAVRPHLLDARSEGQLEGVLERYRAELR